MNKAKKDGTGRKEREGRGRKGIGREASKREGERNLTNLNILSIILRVF